MISQKTGIGTKVWFLDGAFLRDAVIESISDPQVVVRDRRQLVLLVRKQLFDTEAAALRFQSESIGDKLAILELARSNCLARLAELAGEASPVVAEVTHRDGRVETIHPCDCDGCDTAQQCAS